MQKYYQQLKSILGLSFSLAKANFKLRNEGSVLGIFWYLLDPLLLFLIIIFIRGSIAGGTDSSYPLYLLTGLIVFNFFSGTTTRMVGAISESAEYIKSINVRKESLVVSRALQFVFSHFFEIILLAIFAIFLSGNLASFLIYPFFFCFFFLLVLGIGFILSILGVYLRDMANVWSILMRFLWFATPIFYVAKEGTLIYNLNLFNPVYYIITITRNLILGTPLENWMIIAFVLISIFSFIIGLFIFNKFKNQLAEKL